MFDWSDSQDITETDPKDSDTLDPFLCFPELMTKHQLLRVFKMRQINPPKDLLIDGYDYHNLIVLYERLLLPLPQRKYGNSRKSRELSVKQIDCNKRPTIKRKLEECHKTEDNFNKLKARPTEQYSSSETNSNEITKIVSNQRNSIECKRKRVSWP